jgi:1,4-dihydroxy-2-naphthoyl-CoA hydrolase
MGNIWQKEFSLDMLNERGKGCGVEHMGIIVTKVTDNSIYATMPVDKRTKQPIGILHGGSSVFLAESVGSLAANMAVDNHHYCVGQEINANHLKSVTEGIVTAKATPFHLGRTSQVWSIEITDDKDRLICISRLTMAVLKREK